MKLLSLALLAALISVPATTANEPCTITEDEEATGIVCRGPTGEGLGCVAITGNWTGAGCGLVGFDCLQVIWGHHDDRLSIGGHNSCFAGVFVNPPPLG